MDLIRNVKDLIIGTGSNTDLVSANQFFSVFVASYQKSTRAAFTNRFLCVSPLMPNDSSVPVPKLDISEWIGLSNVFTPRGHSREWTFLVVRDGIWLSNDI